MPNRQNKNRITNNWSFCLCTLSSALLFLFFFLCSPQAHPQRLSSQGSLRTIPRHTMAAIQYHRRVDDVGIITNNAQKTKEKTKNKVVKSYKQVQVQVHTRTTSTSTTYYKYKYKYTKCCLLLLIGVGALNV